MCGTYTSLWPMNVCMAFGSYVILFCRLLRVGGGSEVVQPEKSLEKHCIGAQACDMQVISALGEDGLYLCPELGGETYPIGILFCGCHAGVRFSMA